MKGGGDAVSAARAVLQTGEYDFAWNMQVEDEILLRLEKGGKGQVVISPGGNIEHIQLNTTDPWTEVDGERVEHQDQASDPVSDPAVRAGADAAGRPRLGAGVHLRPHRRRHAPTSSTTRSASASKNTKCEFNVDKANQSSTRPAGRRAPTASAPRTARS